MCYSYLIDVFGKSYYFQNTTGSGNNSQIPILDILAGFLGTPSFPASGHGLTAADLDVPSGLFSIQSLITNQDNQSNAAPTRPKAFINVIFFDEQFKSYDYRVSMTGSNSIVKDHYSELQNITAGKNGYVFIYCSNESPVDVFFDNLQVVHTRGRILEETHYYPFGLTMAGISSKALNGAPENKYKFNGIEQSNDFDLNMYDAFYRNLDPQIGRFWQQDPKPTDKESLYSAMGNNPIKNTDFLGDTTIYFSASGQELYRTNDKHKNGVTFIANDNVGGFNLLTKGLDLLEVNTSGSVASSLMRGLGETYNTQSVFDYVDGNAKNYTPDKTFSPNDGKGPLINEASAAVEKKDGAWTVNPSKTDPTNQQPFASSKVRNGVNGITLHTHDNEGRKFKLNSTGQTGTVESGAKSASGDNSILKPGTGLFEMAAGKKAIYFYNSSGVVLTLDRNAFTPKKEDKR